MVKIIVSGSILFILVISFSPSHQFLEYSTVNKTRKVNVLSKKCVNEMSKLNLNCTDSVMVKWSSQEKNDKGFITSRIRCCSMWETADCLNESVMVGLLF